MLAGVLVLALPACSNGLTGTYRCTGIPDLKTLTLESDGRYSSTGDIMGHATAGSGTYKADAHHVTLTGSYRVEGLTVNEPSEVVLDRQGNGQLKSLLTTCRKS